MIWVQAGSTPESYWLKYYFIDICDLTNLAGDHAFWIAGLNPAGSSLNIQDNATFPDTNTTSIIPVIFARSIKKNLLSNLKND